MLLKHLDLALLLLNKLFGGYTLLDVGAPEVCIIKVVRLGLNRHLIGQNLPLGRAKPVLVERHSALVSIILIYHFLLC